MKIKNGYFFFISENGKTGIGECSFIEGLSIDDLEYYPKALLDACEGIEKGRLHHRILYGFPSIQFGVECARLDLKKGGNRILFNSEFIRGEKKIPVNGLIWMGGKDFMLKQIEQKIAAGFRCIKIKVGALDFEYEAGLLKFIREKFPTYVIEIRLDANGAFDSSNVFQKLDILSKFHIHSIEQPVDAGQYKLMQSVCKNSPIPVALDEELIGVDEKNKEKLLSELKPHYIILKPSLLGGFKACDKWIQLAEKYNTGWWATSALESNIGLNAIAQWVFTKNNPIVQGLGTGGLYTNNISSPLYIENGELGYNPQTCWGMIEAK